MHSFKSKLEIIGINPYILVPETVLEAIFVAAQKNKSPIPVQGLINGRPYTQTLVRYAGEWRLYINMKMLKDSPKHVGDIIDVAIDFDERDRTIPLHPKLQEALKKDTHAYEVFKSLTPSLQNEINRYITNLKTEAKTNSNIQRAIDFLNGKVRFVGRDPNH